MRELSHDDHVEILVARGGRRNDSLDARSHIGHRLLAAMVCALRGWPLQVAACDGSDIASAAIRAVLARKPDVVVIVTERLPLTAKAVATLVPTVLDVVDSMSRNMSRRSAAATWPWNAVWHREAVAFSRLQGDLSAIWDGTIVSAERELERYPGATVVCNGADTTSGGRLQASFDVVFTGNLDYWPNVDAVRELCDEIVPLIRTRRPSLSVAVAGRAPTNDVRSMCAASGITLLANVADMDKVLRSARIAVAPLRSATGMQLKVLEALAAGTPVLAYPEAIAGLDKQGGIARCENAAELAEWAVNLLEGKATLAMPEPSLFGWRERASEVRTLLGAVISARP